MMFKKIEKPSLWQATTGVTNEGPCRYFDPLYYIAVLPFSILCQYLLSISSHDRRSHLLIKANWQHCNFTMFGPHTIPCIEIEERVSRIDFIDNILMVLATLEIIALIALAMRGLRRYSRTPKLNGNQEIALNFYTQNPEYPVSHTPQSVYCSILKDISNEPVCITYKCDGKLCSKVIDYPSLILWFTTSQKCPFTNINLFDSRVTELKFSFDIPETFLIENEEPGIPRNI